MLFEQGKGNIILGQETSKPFAGKKALISGGSSGIGKALAHHLATAGGRVAIADIAPAAPADLPPDVSFFSCDLTQAEAVRTLFTDLQQAGLLPDILVCNAGQGIHEKLTEGDPEKWQAILNLNIMGALRLVRAFVPGMLAQGTGDVVFVSSVSAGRAYPYGGVYAASKAAVQTLAETLRLEVLPTVRVTTVAPGVTDTAFFQNTVSGSQTPESIGFGALTPDEVAQTVVFALTQPEGVALNNLTIRPRAQPF